MRVPSNASCDPMAQGSTHRHGQQERRAGTRIRRALGKFLKAMGISEPALHGIDSRCLGAGGAGSRALQLQLRSRALASPTGSVATRPPGENKGQLQKKSCWFGCYDTSAVTAVTHREDCLWDEAPALCSDTAIPRETQSTQQPSTAWLWSLMGSIPTPTL